MHFIRSATALALTATLSACGTSAIRPATPAATSVPPLATPAPAADSHVTGAAVRVPDAMTTVPVAAPRPPESAPLPAPPVAAAPHDAPPATHSRRAKATAAPEAAAARAAPAAQSTTTTVRGRVVLDVGAGQSLEPGEIAESVVYFLPDGGAPRSTPGRYTIYTHNKQFDPALLVVPVGSTVKFPNQDEILHNVFSTTPGSAFDLGIYGNNESGEFTFRKPGLVLIHCNVHESMQADVLVLDTPYIARPYRDGTFELERLPPGPGKLMLWHPRAARPAPLALGLPAADEVVLHLAITRPRTPSHHNKEGKRYQAGQP